MKTQRSFSKRGFTLMELMVAMAITTIIVTVLVSITSIALDTWNRSRAELRASRQAKSMIDIMAKDLESLVVRKGNNSEWLSAVSNPKDLGDKTSSSNSSKLMFFTAVTDRYEGQIGINGKDNGGDVSCVAYELYYKNPFDEDNDNFKTFVLNRLVVDPDDVFRDMLGKSDLVATLGTRPTPPTSGDTKKSPKDLRYSDQLSDPTNFVCENIFQFTVTFNVQVARVPATASSPAEFVTIPVMIGGNTDNFAINGTKITNDFSGSGATSTQIESGKITSVEIAVTVLSDLGVERIKTDAYARTSSAAKSKFMAQNSYEYTKVVPLPSM